MNLVPFITFVVHIMISFSILCLNNNIIIFLQNNFPKSLNAEISPNVTPPSI